MPPRPEPFLTDSIYHIFNRTIDGKEIFSNTDNCLLFLQLFEYYRSDKATTSFSKLKTLERYRLNKLKKDILIRKYYRVEILACCLMPSHFHLLLKQCKEGGVQKFVSNIVNSFTKSYNVRNKRVGPLFLPKFRSVSISTDDQLIHVSRYIHLNPYSGGIIKKVDKLKDYSFSSFNGYISSNQDQLVQDTPILELFDKDKRKYRDFVYDNASYQKTLEEVKYQSKW
ncbi:hypothetical protein FJY90_03525 [Candidatus Gottesmanbacteria bacterium]|nr:hypothetical protein [Candidatus Gottesmanbacteria bacterium]